MSVLREASQRSLEMRPSPEKCLVVTFICVLFGTFSRKGAPLSLWNMSFIGWRLKGCVGRATGKCLLLFFGIDNFF